METEAIQQTLADWADEQATDPELGVPPDAKLRVEGGASFLIGPTEGAEDPSSGVRSHLFDLEFSLGGAVAEDEETALFERLRDAAKHDPSLGGRLPAGSYAELGAVSQQPRGPERRLSLQARVVTLEQ